MSIAVQSPGSALAQVNRASPELSEVQRSSETKRRATSLLGSGLTVNAGYYVAHPDPGRVDGRPEDEELPANS
ncbi:MAG: hypothetical protein ACTHJW_21435 [Streptosporangiaceae bacterium]